MLVKKGKKSLALLLAVVMILGMLPVSAFAIIIPASPYIDPSETLYYDEDGTAVESTEDWVVKMSKTAETTGVENRFKITLGVDARDSTQIVTNHTAIAADVVLAFDVSTSMDYSMGDGTRWSALKGAADTFIDDFLTSNSNNRVSIVAYGGSNSISNSIDDAVTIQNWTSTAATAKASYNYTYVVGEGGLRQHYFGDTAYAYGATNSQAGFRGADALLDTSTNTIKYVIYMSDGEANVFYSQRSYDEYYRKYIYTPTLTGGARTCSYLGQQIGSESDDSSFLGKHLNAENSSVLSSSAAIAQLAELVRVHDVTVYTVGFGTDAANSAVLTSTNSIYRSAMTDVDLEETYNDIEEVITLASNPWKVFDLMGTYVIFDAGLSALDSRYATFDNVDKELTWDVAAQAAASPVGTTHFSLSYYVTLDASNVAVWGKDDMGTPGDTTDDTYHFNPANGDTKLIYKIVTSNGKSHYALAPFDVPDVAADVYTITLDHYLNGSATPFKTETLTGIAGSAALDLDSKISATPGTTYTGRDKLNTDGATIDFSSATNGTVISYNYTSGYNLTIKYVGGNPNASPINDYVSVLQPGDPYSVPSPTIVTNPDQLLGYSLKYPLTDTTVTGVMPDRNLVITVVYEKDNYGVTYRFSGIVPEGVSAPTDSKTYHYNDLVDVQSVSTQPDGWTFNGWTIDGNAVSDPFAITGNTELVGTWTQATYSLDEIYQFANSADLTAYQDGLVAAGQAAYNTAYAAFDQTARAKKLAYDAYVDAFVPEAIEGGGMTTPVSIADFTGDTSAYAGAALAEAIAAADTASTDASTSPLGTFHASYEGLENVFVKELGAYNHGYAYSITPQTIENFKTQLAAGSTNPGTVTADTNVLFLLVNDLFSVTVNHYWQAKDGNISMGGKNYTLHASVSGGSYNSTDTYTITAADYSSSGYTMNKTISAAVPGNYTMLTSNESHNLYYDIAKYDVGFTFTSTDNPAAPVVPTALTGLWHGIDTVTDPDLTAPDGWDFDGWYTDETLETPFTGFGSFATANLQLFGAWSRETYDVDFSFVGNVPTTEGEPIAPPTAQNGISFEGTATAPDSSTYSADYDTTSQDYTFVGWFTNPNDLTSAYDFTTPVTANTTIYGVWTVSTQKYAYTVAHYLDDSAEPLFVTDGANTIDFGTTIDTAGAAACAVDPTDARFTAAVGHNNLTFSSATGCVISDAPSNNVVKCYYTTSEYALTIHYIYADATGSTAATNYSSQVAYGHGFSVDSPFIAHHSAALTGTTSAAMSGLTVSGTMPNHALVLTVVYTPFDKNQYIVNYYWTNPEGTDVSISATTYGPMTWSDESCDVNDPTNITSEKTISGYSYLSTTGSTSGTMDSDKYIDVYFTRDTGTLNVYYVDDTGAADLSANNRINESVYVNDTFTATAIAPPSGYKLLSVIDRPDGTTLTGTTVTGSVAEKDSVTNITYHYAPLGSASVKVEFWLVDTSSEEITKKSVLYTGSQSYTEGNDYDVARDITTYGPTYGSDNQYTFLSDNDRAYTGTLADNAEITIERYYTLNTYGYTVNYVNGRTGADLGTKTGTAPYGTVMTKTVVANDLGSDWVNAYRPSGYRAGTATTITIGADPAKNVITVTYTYSSGGGDDNPYIPPTNPPVEEPPVIDVPEEEVPLSEPPAEEVPLSEPPAEIVIVEDGVPQGNLPQTGTTADAVKPMWTLGMMALSLSMAAIGLTITFSRKKEEAEEK